MNLTPTAIASALPRIEPGLAKYLDIQSRVGATDVATDRDFQRAFNGFYRVRRDARWQGVFYGLLEREKSERRSFEHVLRDLHRDLGRYEASFASKLVATLDPSQPVLDAFVLKNLGVRLPSATSRDRLAGIVAAHRQVGEAYEGVLATDVGQALIAAFDDRYPATGLHPVKKLDLVLWQTR